jgi:heterodisulfide reductase subunit B
VKYIYYPGCTVKSISRHYDMSSRYILNELGLDYKELKEWNCCGTIELARSMNVFQLLLNFKILSEASEEGNILFTVCNGCLSNLLSACKWTEEDYNIRDIVSKGLEEIGLKYNYPTKVTHLLDIIMNDVGLDEIKKRIKRVFKGVKMASYPGCQLIRPSHLINIDDPNNPILLDKLIEVLGGILIDYNSKLDCCGGPILLKNDEIAFAKASNIIESVVKEGAEAIVVACPLCQLTLELTQIVKDSVKIPVIYFTQLLAYSFGADLKDIGIEYNLIPAEKVFKKSIWVRKN